MYVCFRASRVWLAIAPTSLTFSVLTIRGVDRYSHGFLFPSEVKRVQEGVIRDLQRLAQQTTGSESAAAVANTLPGQHVAAPEKWTHSTVSKFHVRYSPPMADLNLDYSVEALVEGSDMSMVHDGARSSLRRSCRRFADVLL